VFIARLSGGSIVKYLALVAACLLTVTLAAPAVADDLATPTFTWPEVTSFNPDVHSYEVTVSGEGDYPYRLSSDGGWVEVTGPGTYSVEFGGPSQARVRAVRCVDTCEPIAESPVLTIVRGVNASWEYDDSWLAVAPGGSRTLRYKLYQDVPGTILQWYVVPAGDDPSAAVTSGDVSDPAVKGTVTIQVPADARHGDKYEVLLHAELDGDAYGHLTSDAQPAAATIDGEAPELRIKLDDDVIYPVADLDDWGLKDYPSHLEYQLFSTERVTGTLTFTGPGGVVAERRTGLDFGPSGVYENWYGEGRHHTVYPEGRYEIRLDVADEAGNAATTSATVYLSHAKQRPVRVRPRRPSSTGRWAPARR
jgi:hypothetical protein